MPLFNPVGGSAPGISATGGTITESGLYKIHTFGSSGTFQVTANPDNQIIEILCIGGGGSGGAGFNLGGTFYYGIGGFSGAWSIATFIPSVTSYSVTVGAGGATATAYSYGNDGGSSSFGSVLTAAGGTKGGTGQGSHQGVAGAAGFSIYFGSSTTTSYGGQGGEGSAGGYTITAAGGSPYGGNGGYATGAGSGVAGSAATGIGGGGGGGGVNSGPNTTGTSGGAGFKGTVIVRYRK